MRLSVRLSTIRACAIAAVASSALAACAGNGTVPAGSSQLAPTAFDEAMARLKLTTCATDPPQWQWIFKGACDKFTLKSTGGKFTLGTYDDISVTGSIGYNTVKGTITIDLADALDKNSDVEKYKGKAFPPYKGNGTTIVYAVADNQSTQTVKPLEHKNVPILEYVITDTKGFPGKDCGAAILEKQKNGTEAWNPLPSQFPVKGDKVTITQYTVPQGLELPPKGTGLYFAINCFS